MPHYPSVDAYLAAQPAALQAALQQLRSAIKTAAPTATEDISYSMPAYKYLGHPLVYFGLSKTHIGFYALPVAVALFSEALSGYSCSKGTVRFPLDKPLPVALIKKMVRYRLTEIEEAAVIKKEQQKKKQRIKP